MQNKDLFETITYSIHFAAVFESQIIIFIKLKAAFPHLPFLKKSQILHHHQLTVKMSPCLSFIRAKNFAASFPNSSAWPNHGRTPLSNGGSFFCLSGKKKLIKLQEWDTVHLSTFQSRPTGLELTLKRHTAQKPQHE